ncbi:hypothetical protein [Bradyrhizobium sp. 168]|uniref:hypothetical protein n=1 Tax=Bradyrhizobium sp. 168 TaxID=2782639 RepID=UPI001FF825F8|nr:hypothetical protein [Bradyrhizobium sp. 168]
MARRWIGVLHRLVTSSKRKLARIASHRRRSCDLLFGGYLQGGSDVRKNERDVWAAETPTAHQAVAMIATLQQSAEEIRFISSPQEGEMGIEMLRLLAKEEAEELPRAR